MIFNLYLSLLIYLHYFFSQTIHVFTQRHLGHFTCLWENCRHYGISYNCAPSWPDHHMLTHTGKTFECFIPGCKKIFKTEVLQRRHITHHLDIISTSNNHSKHRDSLVAKSARKTSKKHKQRRIPYSANRPDYFDRTVMENLAKRLQIFEKCSQGIIEYSNDMSISVCLQHKVVATRTLLNGVREKLVRYYPPFIVDEEWVPIESVLDKHKKVAWSIVSDTGKFYLMKFLNNRKKLLHQQIPADLAMESKTTLTNKTDINKKILHQCEKNNNSVPSNQNLIVKRITRAKSASKVK
uniref:Zinc finger protein jing n=1 Tax=Cacopsylla melanoneura TaxID=428564 RepID=A0A8D8VZ54_9HEMI